MTTTPIVGDMIWFYAGRDRRHGGFRPLPGIVHRIDETAGTKLVAVTVFGGPSPFNIDRVPDHDAWSEQKTADPGWDADAHGYWTWPERP